MAQFYEIKKFVEFVDNQYREFLKDDFMVGFTADDKELMYSETSKLVEDYGKKSGLSYHQVIIILEEAKAHGFITDGSTDSSKLIVNPDRGYSLLQKRWGLPTGLMRAVVKENGHLVSIVIGVVVAVATVINLIIGYNSRSG